ncbi:MAG: hypothetical protein RLZZ383_3039 [Pseudomonadota bacterium]|jgi:hypothetical protein
MRRIWWMSVALLAACGGASKDPIDTADTAETDTAVQLNDADADGVPDDLDCDDANPDVKPGQPEVCNGLDDDCDGFIDSADANVDPTSQLPYYADADGDGVGADLVGTFCDPPGATATTTGDCDDNDSRRFPGNPELCNALDDNCDTLIDEADPALDPSQAFPRWPDLDGDGFGDDAAVTYSCTEPATGVQIGGDCNDADPAISPSGLEVCSGADENCDGLIDEADPTLDPAGLQTVWFDGDGDGYGDPFGATQACFPPLGYATNEGDCNDFDPLAWTGAPEICDGIDNNCIDGIDADDPAFDPTERVWYADLDGDGYGDPAVGTPSCAQPPGTSGLDRDCNDADPLAWTGNLERCDGSDNDCDGGVDVAPIDGLPYYVDADGDGFGDAALVVNACGPGPGLSDVAGDCNDADVTSVPGAAEACDGVDNDCDGLVDGDDPDFAGGAVNTFYADVDGDGYGDDTVTASACAAPEGYVDAGGDCDDAATAVFPGAAEICDALDNDCDGLTDDADADYDPSTVGTWYADLDADGYGDPAAPSSACVAPVGTVGNAEDCNDTEPLANNNAIEVCDGVDNDCDGGVDQNVATGLQAFADADGDGFGDPAAPVTVCALGAGIVDDDNDCDDAAPATFPGAPEICDGDDNDCDGLSDQADPDFDPSQEGVFYADADGDGYGDDATAVTSCGAPDPTGWASQGGDCDDAAATVNPGAVEVCDPANRDEDCDGAVDDADRNVSELSKTTFYLDNDRDGFGGPTQRRACDASTTLKATSEDCNDAAASINPAAAEVCDEIDNDCDGDLDALDASIDPSLVVTVYVDADGDGYGNPRTTLSACSVEPGFSAQAGDCNDAEPLAWTGNPEVCDGADNDCNRLTDDADPNVDPNTGATYWLDDDGDSYGTPSTSVFSCSAPAGYVANDGDCNDAEPLAWTGAREVCDGGVDNDCQNLADDRDPNVDRLTGIRVWTDADGDGHGILNGGFRRCVAPAGTATVSDDCNDAQPLAWNNAPEVCDDVDNDCDGALDDADSNFDISSGTLAYADADADGQGDPLEPVYVCDLAGVSTNNLDCDDTDARAYQGATEVCDLVDNDCDNLTDDADPTVDRTGIDPVYADFDRDGYGAGRTFNLCPIPGRSFVAGDCDDRNAARSPGNTELCNSIDDDCDGDIDVDAWWDEAWPYRVLVDVSAPATRDGGSLPVSVDVDFSDLLLTLGEGSAFEAGSVRVVRQSCAAGLPEIPADFVDTMAGLFDKVAMDDPAGDGFGAVVFLADDDGDYTTTESFPAGTEKTYAIYFSAEAFGAYADAVYPSSVLADTDGTTSTLENSLTYSQYPRSLGGLASLLGPAGGDTRVGSQTSSNLGNGIFFNTPGGGPTGRWLSARDGDAALTVLHSGDVLGAVRSAGSRSSSNGGFSYTYDYFLFEGRPEVYAKVRFVINQSSNVGPQGTQWSAAVRPWLTDNLAMVTAGNGEEGAEDSPGYTWVRGGYDLLGANPTGVAAGWRSLPLARGNPVNATDGRYVGLVGQDRQSSPSSNEIALVNGDVVVDHSVVAVYPYEGLWASVEDDFLATLLGTSVVTGAPEQNGAP